MKKRRILFVVAVVILVVIAVCFATTKTNIQKSEEQCRDVYVSIQDEVFFTGEWTGNTVLLYDNDFQEIKRLSTKHDLGKESIKIVKERDQIRFVLGGSVDDEYGILFVDSATVNMSGFHSVKRLSGNSYYYETR